MNSYRRSRSGLRVSSAAEVREPPLRFLPPSLVRLFGRHVLVQLDRPRSITQLSLVEPGGPHPGVERGVRVPLHAPLVISRGPAVLRRLAVFVNVAELERRVAALVARRILPEQLLQEQLATDQVVGVLAAEALAL